MAFADTFSPRAAPTAGDREFSFARRVGCLLAVHAPQLEFAHPTLLEQLDGMAVNARLEKPLTAAELAQAAEFFNAVDNNNEGRVTATDLANYLEVAFSVGLVRDSALVRCLFDVVSAAAHPGTRTAPEFIIWMCMCVF